MGDHPPFLNAGNGGPFTLDGTRAYRVGRRSVALVDPGPDVETHVRALASFLADATDVRIVLTHGHADHAAAAPALARALGCAILGPDGVSEVDQALGEGAVVSTDEGDLVAVWTPGHARAHLTFHWPARSAVFVGDLMLGEGDTTWVGEYPGCVADYLASLDRVRSLAPRVLYPAHGAPIEDPDGALDRYESHRRARIRRAEEVLALEPSADAARMMELVYGPTVPEGLEDAALMSVRALLDHVRGGRRS